MFVTPSNVSSFQSRSLFPTFSPFVLHSITGFISHILISGWLCARSSLSSAATTCVCLLLYMCPARYRDRMLTKKKTNSSTGRNVSVRSLNRIFIYKHFACQKQQADAMITFTFDTQKLCHWYKIEMYTFSFRQKHVHKQSRTGNAAVLWWHHHRNSIK